MIKKNLKKLLLTSAVILLPMLAGILLWERLPDTMNLHWGVDGQPDGGAGKAFAVFFPPLLILAAHWLCMFLSAKDLKNQTVKALNLALWICPMLSLVTHSLLYSVALGLEFNRKLLLFVPMGILFMVMGNYMPKFRRNATMGIKTVWALADEENWNATHRFGGKVWFAAGLLIIAIGCLPWNWAAVLNFILLLGSAFAPVVYSWRFYRKKKAAGKEIPVYRSPYGKWVWLFLAVLAVFLFAVMFTGSITYTFGNDALTVDSDRWNPVTVAYEQIDSIEYREEAVDGEREWGFGSARLLLGSFNNDEFGGYTRYT